MSGPYWVGRVLGFIHGCSARLSGRYELPGPIMWVDRPAVRYYLSRQPGVQLAALVVMFGSDAFYED